MRVSEKVAGSAPDSDSQAGLRSALSDQIAKNAHCRFRYSSGLDIRLGTRTCIPRVYPLAGARAIRLTLSPPLHTNFSYIASRMATKRNMEHSQNTCVLLDGLLLMSVLIVTHCSSSGHSASQSAGRECVNPFFCVVILAKNYPGTVLDSLNRTEDHPLDYQRNASR